ncbi:putative homoserine dehydrogenase-like protein [Amaricoccus macauensis]|uniref:Putative homoserine dehydrogenase-like protein n=1 Tax=Amaricoccus macauensis TaxID=57001 RepID=A0A840SUI6_9RHOB|nr:SAF domain-containing protein [Amaricoccus macauensis]MBB5224378.1 putative homoserine dehydrogenase-like protein [Amaricoccus macauensis]
MILVDSALAKLKESGKGPIRVGMIGAGFMASGVLLQINTVHQGAMRVVAVANRTPAKAVRAYAEAGQDDAVLCDSAAALARAIEAGHAAVTEDPMLIATSPHVDVLLEVTGAVEEAVGPVLAAIEHGKHVALMNPELDGTLGPLLKAKADKAGVIFTDVDGDQPGVEGNLWRFVKGLGVRPVLCGNIKGLQDPYRTPTTQKAFAERWGQKPAMVTSFADGTKVSFEQAVVANMTGMTVAKRGCHGYTVEAGTPLMEAAKLWDPAELLQGPGIVDYVVGAAPGPGVFVLGTIEHPRQQHYLNLYKLGEGPIYCFYTPYHLCHFEVPTTIARAALFHDATIAPAGGPCVEVVAIAKRDLKAGEVVDELGGYLVYGECEDAGETAKSGHLPIGVAVGATLLRDVKKDAVLTYADVKLPEGRLVDKLRAEQAAMFGLAAAAE